ncbi:MAG: amylo-alpha-1,6-glucosidase [Candidatus Muiribacteriota bacterium]
MIFKNNKNNYYKLRQNEWLISLGNGSYSMQNLLLIPSRRYHSLYNCALNPPVDRTSYFHSIDETIDINGKFYNLYSCQLDSKNYLPEGFNHIKKISVLPDKVKYTYIIEDIKIIKIFYSENDGILKIKYIIENNSLKKLSFFIRPYFEKRKTDSLNDFTEDFFNTGDIIINENFLFKIDRKSNFIKKKFNKDLFLKNEFDYEMVKHKLGVSSPGYYNYSFYKKKNELNISFGTSEREKKILKLKDKIKFNRRSIHYFSKFSKNFIVNNNDKIYIMAGYPWFGPWGRDTFISLPGLLIYQKHYKETHQVIDSFLLKGKKGIIPNVILESSQTLFNTADASLWLINAVYEFYICSKDKSVIDKYYPFLNKIIFYYRKGTINNIKMDKEDFLIQAGSKKTQLTWMDAKNKGVVFTPRYGKTVEINALWYNAVKIMEFFSKKINLNNNAINFFNLGENIKENFNKKFWNPDKNYLNDFICENGINSQLRPNQLYALSLPFNVVTNKNKMKKIIIICSKHLHTKSGIRTLSPVEKDYKGEYKGNWFERDSCYHQGTVWPFLTGAYFEAFLKTNNFSEISCKFIKKSVKNFIFENCSKTGCGFIPEIFDGDSPNKAQGAPMQAWSCAEILKVYLKYFNH